MIVVSDTSPLSALAEIGEINLLHRLFGNISIPATVLAECQHPGAPQTLRTWAASLPEWAIVEPTPPKLHPAVNNLDPGEADAISIAMLSPGPVLLLVDERAGVRVVQDLGLPFTGTLGVLIRGHQLGLIHFETALASLRRTRFRLSPAIIAHARRILD